MYDFDFQTAFIAIGIGTFIVGVIVGVIFSTAVVKLSIPVGFLFPMLLGILLTYGIPYLFRRMLGR